MGYVYRRVMIRVEMSSWNTTTLHHRLKTDGPPPLDHYSWKSVPYGDWRWLSYSQAWTRHYIHQELTRLTQLVNSEPKRWVRLVMVADYGIETTTGFTLVGQQKLVILGPFNKDRRPVPTFPTVEGRLAFPFNLLPGMAPSLDRRPDLPDYVPVVIGKDQDEPEEEEFEETEAPAPGDKIVVLDSWGNELTTVEVM